MLGAFLDDSGTHPESELVVIGCLLGTDAQWDVFAAQWAELLHNSVPGKPPLSHFHLSECRARRGEFERYNEAEVNAITHDFRRVIIDNGFVTIASAVNVTAWNELLVGVDRDAVGEPLEFCFSQCVDKIVNTIRFRRPGEEVAIFTDQALRKRLGPWADLFKLDLHERYPEIGQFGFPPVKRVIALQGADMIATETYQYDLQWLKDRGATPPNPHFREFFRRELSAGFLLDREHIREWLDRLRTAGRLQPTIAG